MAHRDSINGSCTLSPRASWSMRKVTCTVLLATAVAGCGQGLVPGAQGTASEWDEPAGPAVLYEEGCDAADDGLYLLGFRQAARHDPALLESSLEAVRKAGGTVKASYLPQIAMVSAELPASALPGLRDDPALSFISRNCRHKQQSASLARVPWGLDRIDQRNGTLDYVYQMPGTGRGVDVYVVDSGIYAQHEQFGNRVEGLYKAMGVPDGYGADDCSGHGTIVAGIIGALDYGVAKEAKLYSIRVADCNGVTKDTWIAEGIQQAILHCFAAVGT